MKGAMSRLFGSFSQRLGWLILLLLLILSFIIMIIWYQNSVATINDDFLHRQKNIDQELRQSVNWIDRGIILYEMQFIPQQKRAMEIYMDAYDGAGGDVSKLYLSSLKKNISMELNGTWDLYIIDQKGVVINTTYAPDMGLNFSIWPEFYRLLSDLREQKEFVPDRTVKGLSSISRKFAYQGTPDGKYLLEVSLAFDKFIPDKTGVGYGELISNLPYMNPDILQADLYDRQGTRVSNYSIPGKWEKPDFESKEQISRTFSEGKDALIIDPRSGNYIRYTYLPINDNGDPSEEEMYLTSRIIYSKENRDQLVFYSFLNLIMLLFASCFIAIFISMTASRFISRPLNQLVNDIDIIAAGNLDHKVHPSGSTELQHIEDAVRGLVTNLKLHIRELNEREAQLTSELNKRCRVEENYRRLINSAHDSIFILENSTIISCNIAAGKLIGREISGIEGKKFHELSPEYQPDGSFSEMKFVEFLSKATIENKCSCDWDFIRGDGTVVKTEANLSAVLTEGTILIMGIFRDVTEIHKMRERETYAITQIEEDLVKFAALNDQIRNPLTVITMLTDLGGDHREAIRIQINIIDELITEGDKQYAKSDKVRLFLKKHYGIGQKKGDEGNEL